MNLKKPVRNFLAAQATITANLSTYDFGGASAGPAIFTTRVFPPDFTHPAAIISQIGGPPWGCRDREGGIVDIDIRVYDDKDASSATLDELADKIWRAINRGDLSNYLTIEGYEDWGCRADVPQAIEDEDGYPGFLIRARLRALRNSA